MQDSCGRTIDYLRLSVTDRCNYRCRYCMPAEGVEKRAHGDILSLEELAEIAGAAVACGVKRFFFMSSISLYSPTSVEPVPEDAPKDPATIYGQTKLAGEHLLRWYADNHGIDSRGIRPTWVWGPNRTNGLTTQYTTGLVDSIARGGEVHVDNPDERGDWIYIHDTIKAMLLVWNAEKPAQRFYTVCGSVHTLREVAELTNRLCPEAKVTYAEHSANTSPYACSFDDSAIRKELGYAPEWSIEDSVKDYIRVVMGRD